MRPSRTSVIAIIALLVALGGAAWATLAPLAVRQDAAAVQSQAKSLADQVAEACAKGGPAAAELGPACAKANEVKEQPNVAANVDTAAQPDPAALRRSARTAVDEYCATRNQCRGANGVAPDFDALTNAVLARIPLPKDGAPGKDAPTPDIAGAVAAYCAAHNECAGPPGTNGSAGTPGPTCPDGYELRDAVITAPDQTTYQGKACVDPASSVPPSQSEPPTGG
ncbi:hypothetical protein [Amycolatopsis sp. NPDC001319]|uniref:hypothetical protein n=1 Tax=unclassified Amycolatopsis TaxID=2618356 RepID=UPI0036900EB5